MKNLSTGTGLALLATAIVAYPLVNRISSVNQTAHASVPVAAIAAPARANPSSLMSRKCSGSSRLASMPRLTTSASSAGFVLVGDSATGAGYMAVDDLSNCGL